jgi:hypothetical protein
MRAEYTGTDRSESMRPEEKAFKDTMAKAAADLTAAQRVREREAAAITFKQSAARAAREEAERERLLASLTPEEKETQELLARIAKADPHGYNEQNPELAQWRADLAKRLRRFELLRAMEAVRDEEAERVAAQPTTRQLSPRFTDPTDFVIVVHTDVEAHHRVLAVTVDGEAQRWRVPALAFVAAAEADFVRDVLQAEEDRRRAMGTQPATFGTLLSPEEWSDPFLVARAAGVEITDGRDAWTGPWLSVVSNDERVSAVWVEAALGRQLIGMASMRPADERPGGAAPFADAIERAAKNANDHRPHVASLEVGRAYWRQLAAKTARNEASEFDATSTEHAQPEPAQAVQS